MNSSDENGNGDRISSSNSPRFFGPLNAIIGDYGQRLISAVPENRDAVLMELTAKWSEIYVQGAYECVQTHEDCLRFHGRLENLRVMFWHDLGPILTESDKATAVRALEAMIALWRGKAWAKLAPASVGPTESESGKTGISRPRELAFPRRASWLKERLLERGFSTSDPSKYGGPDRKTIEKILRGGSVRNDVLEKLADALSKKGGKVGVLDFPES